MPFGPGPSQTQDDRQIPIVVGFSSRDGTTTKDGRIVNGYLDIDKANGKKRIRRRPGLTQSVAAIGLGQGLGSVGGQAIAIAGNLLVSVSSTLTGTSTTVPFSGNAEIAVFNGSIWVYNVSGATYVTNIPSLTYTLKQASAPANTSGTPGFMAFGSKLYTIATVGGPWWSTDGITWTNAVSGGAGNYLIGLGATVYVLPAALTNGATYYYSTDAGLNYVSGTISLSGAGLSSASYAIGVHRGTMYAINTTRGYTSTDGTNWTLLGGALPTGAVTRMASLNGLLYVQAANGNLYSSPTGVTWTLAGSNGASNGGGLAIINNLLAFTSGAGPTAKVGYYRTSQTVNISGSFGTTGFGSGEQVDTVSNTSSTKVLIKGRNIAYVFDPLTGLATQVTDADYPVTVRGAIYIDGVFYVMENDGTILGSADEDPSSWDPLDFVNAEIEPDGGVCLTKYLNYAVALGEWTVQFFWDAGNTTGSALSPVQNGVIMIGCAHGDSVAQIESTVLWLAQRKGSGSTSQKGRFIAQLQGTSYVQVSTPDVDRVLDADDLASVYSCAVTLNGKAFYLLSLKTSLVTLAYDMTDKLWYTMTRRTASAPVAIASLTQSNGTATATATSHGLSDGDFVVISGATQSGYNLSLPITYVDANTFTYPVAAATVSPATGSPVVTGSTESYFDMTASVNLNGVELVLDAGTGTVWSLSPSVFTDNSQPIDMRIRTNPVDNGNNENKFCSSVSAITDLTSSAQTALLRTTDDDYQTYSTYRRFDLSQVRNNVNRWGRYRRRAWEWRYNGTATDHRIEALEVDIEQGVT